MADGLTAEKAEQVQLCEPVEVNHDFSDEISSLSPGQKRAIANDFSEQVHLHCDDHPWNITTREAIKAETYSAGLVDYFPGFAAIKNWVRDGTDAATHSAKIGPWSLFGFINISDQPVKVYCYKYADWTQIASYQNSTLDKSDSVILDMFGTTKEPAVSGCQIHVYDEKDETLFTEGYGRNVKPGGVYVYDGGNTVKTLRECLHDDPDQADFLIDTTAKMTKSLEERTGSPTPALENL